MWFTFSARDRQYFARSREDGLLRCGGRSPQQHRDFQAINVSHPDAQLRLGHRFCMLVDNHYVRRRDDGVLVADIDPTRVGSSEDTVPGVFYLSRTSEGETPSLHDLRNRYVLWHERVVPPDNTWRDILTAFLAVHGVMFNPTPMGIIDAGVAVGLSYLVFGDAESSIEKHRVFLGEGDELRTEAGRRNGEQIDLRPIGHRVHLRVPGVGFVAARDGERELYASSPNRGPWETFTLAAEPRGRLEALDFLRHGDCVQLQGVRGKWVWAVGGGGREIEADGGGAEPPPITIEKVGWREGEPTLIEHGDRVRLCSQNWWFTVSPEGRRDLRASAREAEDAAAFIVEFERPLILHRSEGGDSLSVASFHGLQGAAGDYQRLDAQAMVRIGPAHGHRPLKLFTNARSGDSALAAAPASEAKLRNTGYEFVRIEGFIHERPFVDGVPLRSYRRGQALPELRGFPIPDISRAPDCDHLCIAQREDERWAAEQGYRFVRQEGYVRLPPNNAVVELDVDIDPDDMQHNGVLDQPGMREAFERQLEDRVVIDRGADDDSRGTEGGAGANTNTPESTGGVEPARNILTHVPISLRGVTGGQEPSKTPAKQPSKTPAKQPSSKAVTSVNAVRARMISPTSRKRAPKTTRLSMGSGKNWLLGGPASTRLTGSASRRVHEQLRDTPGAHRDLRVPRVQRTRRIEHALVLSGGGAKGAFEVGAALKLWEDGYRPDLVCGVSVGALNGAVLAEREEPGQPTPAQRLEQLWRSIAVGRRPYHVFNENYYLDRLMAIAQDKGEELLLRLGGAPFTLGTSLIGVNFAGLPQEAQELITAFHSIHSLQPLREMIHEEIRPLALRDSPVGLRLGMVDLRTGRYMSAASADPTWPDELAAYGRIELEPDHQVGDDWLSRPLFGADNYLMKLEDAVYNSSVQPVFMEAKLTRLDELETRRQGEELFAMLEFMLPPALQELLDRAYEAGQDDRDFGPDSTSHSFFDGGLRDTMPIRTAMRLGARRITVISGDLLHSAPWSAMPVGESLEATPAFQNMLGLLQIWFNDAARNDLMLAVGHNELLGALYRAYSLLDNEGRHQLERDLDRYWRKQGRTLRDTLGGATLLGGESSMRARGEAGISPDHYGAPLHDEGCEITFIHPDREILTALDFHNHNRIHEAIELGYERAKDPVVLSKPVPDELLRSDD